MNLKRLLGALGDLILFFLFSVFFTNIKYMSLIFSSFWGKTTCSLANIVLYVIKDVQFTPLHTLIDKDEIPTAQIHNASDLQFQ
jgi:hypothetical protein